MSPAYLHGLHDAGGEHLMEDRPGWVVITGAKGIGADPNDRSGGNFSALAGRGFGVIVRLNHGYGVDGTIPAPDAYAGFAQRVANFIEASSGCGIWVIGNEPNHLQERPGGKTITPAMYAQCFRMVWEAVRLRNLAGRRVDLVPAAVAPWNIQSGDWLEYQRAMLTEIGDMADGIAIHTYTHGPGRELITSEATMQSPFADRRFHFRAYRDLLNAVPAWMRGLPAYITETNQGDLPWLDQDTGWVQAACQEIDEWNRTPGAQRIHCVALYRLLKDDKWRIDNKPKVQEMFRRAVEAGYAVPALTVGMGTGVDAGSTKHRLNLPFTAAAASVQPARVWDPRLTQRGVQVHESTPEAGAVVWRVVRGHWFDVKEAGGRHHIYVETIDENGQPLADMPFLVIWPSGDYLTVTNGRQGFDAGNYPMSASKNDYSVWMGGELPSDVVTGIGMGAETDGWINPKEHTATLLVFQRTPAATATMEIPESPSRDDAPDPQPEPPGSSNLPAGIIEPLVAETVLQVESGGAGFDEQGRLKIRVEAHLLVGDDYGNSIVMAGRFRFDPNDILRAWYRNATGEWVLYHDLGQDGEWAAFELAASLDYGAALRCISMGLGQVMGFNAGSIGYPSAEAMFAAFRRSANVQLIGFFNYCLGRPALMQAMRERDWRTIARLYNGPALVDVYAARLVGVYRELTGGG